MSTNYSLTDAYENRLVDHENRAATLPKPISLKFRLHVIKGKWQSGQAIASGDYIAPSTHNGRLYKAGGAGTTGGSEPTWPTTDGGTVNDNGITWTEQSIQFDAGNFPALVSGGGYADQVVTPSDTAFEATQGGTSGASTGTSGATQNATAITFAATASADWGTVGLCSKQAEVSSGVYETWRYLVLNNPMAVSAGATSVGFPVGSMDELIG